MLINGVNLDTFGVELYDRVLSTNSVTTRREWLDGDIQPTFIRQQDKFKTVKLSFLVLNVNEDEAFRRISRLTQALKRASIEFEDIHLTFDMMLVGKAEEKRLKNGNFIVTYNLISDYAKGEREIYTTNANATNSFKLTVLYYENSNTLLATDSVTIRAAQFLNEQASLSSIGINLNKYRPSYHNEGVTTNFLGSEFSYEALRDLQVLIINYEPTRYNLELEYFMDNGSGVYAPIANSTITFTYPQLQELRSIGELIDVRLFKPEGYKADILYQDSLTVSDLLSASPIYIYYTRVDEPRVKSIVVEYQTEDDNGDFENINFATVVVDETGLVSGMTLSDIININAHRPNVSYYLAGEIVDHEANELISFDTLESSYTIKYRLSENIIYVEYYAGTYPGWYRLATIPVTTKYNTSYDSDFSITDAGIVIDQYKTATYNSGQIARGDVDSYMDLLSVGVVQIYYEPIDYPITVRYWEDVAVGTPISEETIYINELDFFSNPVLTDIIPIATNRPEGWQFNPTASYSGDITLAALTQASPINIVYEEIVELRVKNIIVKYKQEMASAYSYIDTVILTINEADTVGGVRLRDIINLNLRKPTYYQDGIIDGASSVALLTFEQLQSSYEVAYVAQEYYTPVRYFLNEVSNSAWIGSTNIHYKVIDFSAGTSLYNLGLDLNAFKPQTAGDGQLLYTGPVNFESLVGLEAINVLYETEAGTIEPDDLEYPHRFLFLQHNDLGDYESQHPTWSFTHSFINTGVTVDDMSRLSVIMECKVLDPDTPMSDVNAGKAYLFGSSSASGSFYMRFNNQTQYGSNLTGVNLYEANAGKYTNPLTLTEGAAVGFSENSGITSSQRAGYSYATFTYTSNLQSEAAEMRYPLYLFANNNAGHYEGGIGNVGIYSCRIYYDDQLIRDFIPVRYYDKIGNKVAPENGLYDKVTGNFFIDGSGNNGFNIIDDERYVDTNPEHNIGACYVNYRYGDEDGFSRTFWFRESEFLNGEITNIVDFFKIDEYQRPYFKSGVLTGVSNLVLNFNNINGKTFNVYYEPETNIIQVSYYQQTDPEDVETRTLLAVDEIALDTRMFYQAPDFGDIVRLNKYRPEGYKTDFQYDGLKVSLQRVMDGAPYSIVYIPETDDSVYTFTVRYIKDVFGIRVYETIAEDEITLTASEFREGEYIDYHIDANKYKPARFYADGIYYGQYVNGELMNWYAMDERITTPEMLHDMYIIRYMSIAQPVEIRYYKESVAEENLIATKNWFIKVDDWDPRIDDGMFQVVDELPNEYFNLFKPASCSGGELQNPSTWYTFADLIDQGHLDIVYPRLTQPHDPTDESYKKRVVFFGALDGAMYLGGSEASSWRTVYDYALKHEDGISPPDVLKIPSQNNNNAMDRDFCIPWKTPGRWLYDPAGNEYMYSPGDAEQLLNTYHQNYLNGYYPNFTVPDYAWDDMYRVWGYYGPRHNFWRGCLPCVDLGYNPKDTGRLRVEIKCYAQSSGYTTYDVNPYTFISTEYLHFFGFYSPDRWKKPGVLGASIYPYAGDDEFHSYPAQDPMTPPALSGDDSLGGAGFFAVGIDLPVARDYVYTTRGYGTIDGWRGYTATMSQTDAPEGHPRNRITYSARFRRGYAVGTDDEWEEFIANYTYGVSKQLRFFDNVSGILDSYTFVPSRGPNAKFTQSIENAPTYYIDDEQMYGQPSGLYAIPVTIILDAWNNYYETYTDLDSSSPTYGTFNNQDENILEARPMTLGTLSVFTTTDPVTGQLNSLPSGWAATPGWSSITNWQLRTETIAKGNYNPYSSTFTHGYTYQQLVGTSTVTENGQTQVVYTYQTREINVAFADNAMPCYPMLSGCAIWGIKIYDRDKLVRDLIPVGYADQIYGYTMPGNGFFDKETEIFFGNTYKGGDYASSSSEYNTEQGYHELMSTYVSIKPSEVLPLLTIDDPTVQGKVVVNYYDYDNNFIDNQFVDVPTWICKENTSVEDMLQFNDFKPDDFHLNGMVDLDVDITYSSWTPEYIVDMGTVNVYYKLRTFSKTVVYYQGNKRIGSQDLFYSLDDIQRAQDLDDLNINVDLFYTPEFAHGRLVFDESILASSDMAAFIDAPSPIVVYDKLTAQEDPNIFYVEYYRGGASSTNLISLSQESSNYLDCDLEARALNPNGVVVYTNHFHSALYEDEVFDYYQPYQARVINRYAGIHKGPGKKYATLAMIVRRDIVTVEEERKGWARLREYPKGWIPLTALRKLYGPGQNPNFDVPEPEAITIPFGALIHITRLTVDRLWAEYDSGDGVTGWIKTEEISYTQQGDLYNAIAIEAIHLDEIDWSNVNSLYDMDIDINKYRLYYHDQSDYTYSGEYTLEAFQNLHEIEIIYPETIYTLNMIYYQDDINDDECELGRSAFSFSLSDWHPDWDIMLETSYQADENDIPIKPTLYRTATPLLLTWDYFGLDKNLFKPNDAAADGIVCWNSHSWDTNPTFSFAEMIICPGQKILYPCVNPNMFKVFVRPGYTESYYGVTKHYVQGAAAYWTGNISTRTFTGGSLPGVGRTGPDYDVECAIEDPAWSPLYSTQYGPRGSLTPLPQTYYPEQDWAGIDFNSKITAIDGFTVSGSASSYGQYEIHNVSTYRDLASVTIHKNSFTDEIVYTTAPNYYGVNELRSPTSQTVTIQSVFPGLFSHGGIFRYIKAWSRFMLTKYVVPLPAGFKYKWKGNLQSITTNCLFDLVKNVAYPIVENQLGPTEFYLINDTVLEDAPFRVSEQDAYELEDVNYLVTTTINTPRAISPSVNEGTVYTQGGTYSPTASGLEYGYQNTLPAGTLISVSKVTIPNTDYPDEYYKADDQTFWIKTADTSLASFDGTITPIHKRGFLIGNRYSASNRASSYAGGLDPNHDGPYYSNQRIWLYKTPNDATSNRSFSVLADRPSDFIVDVDDHIIPPAVITQSKYDPKQLLFTHSAVRNGDATNTEWLFVDGIGWVKAFDTSLGITAYDTPKPYIVAARLVNGFSIPFGEQKIYRDNMGIHEIVNPADYLVVEKYHTHRYYQGDRLEILYRLQKDPYWAWTGVCWIQTDRDVLIEAL